MLTGPAATSAVRFQPVAMTRDLFQVEWHPLAACVDGMSCVVVRDVALSGPVVHKKIDTVSVDAASRPQSIQQIPFTNARLQQ
jgi:hypothetical protein